MKKMIGIASMVLAAAAPQAGAQGYPNKPVHLIISFSPGSSTDIVGRVVAQKLAEMWGQPVLAENRAGAGGSIGTAFVAKAAADGYTLLIDSNAHAVTPSIYAKLPYDVEKDFVDIVPLAVQPNVLIVNAGSPYKNLMDVVNAAKINVTQVPFKGTPEVIQAMLSQSVDCYWAPISAAIPHIKGGRVRPLAVSTTKRNGQLPDVPTTGEAGIQGADAPLWFALWGPAGIPAGIVSKISADTRKALKDPAVRDRLVGLGNDTMDMSPEEFKIFVQSEVQEYARVVKAAGIQPQ